MDVTFETTQGRRFTIEIWYFSTVRRIKEYILQHEGIPVEKQWLFFMGRELQDDRDTEYYSIVQGSHVLLVLRNDVTVVVSAPSVGRNITLNLNTTDTVARLKEVLEDHTEGVLQANHINAFFDKVQMEDAKVLGDYSPSDDGKVLCVIVTQTPQHNITGVKKHELTTVKVRRCSQMVILKMSSLDVVKELRAELGRVAPHFLQALDNGCFFAYKQNVMDEDRTLHWHKVKNGDTIKIIDNVVKRED